MPRRPLFAAVLLLTAIALVGLGPAASAGWRFDYRADLDVATSLEAQAGAGASAEWAGDGMVD